MSDAIKVTHAASVLEVVLDRPRKKNALTFAMYEGLTAALRGAMDNPAVRVVVISGSSDGDAFCAGNDLNDFLAAVDFDPGTAPPIRFIEALVAFDKPLVMAVHGAAVGIGTTMLLHADLVYASASARFSVPFVGLGLVPEAGSSLLLPRRVGHAAASDMLLRGAVVDATRALALGLVNELAPDHASLLALARSRAAEVAAKPPGATRAAKALSREDPASVLARARVESAQFAQRVRSPEAREAFSAFLEKRAPDFTSFA